MVVGISVVMVVVVVVVVVGSGMNGGAARVAGINTASWLNNFLTTNHSIYHDRYHPKNKVNKYMSRGDADGGYTRMLKGAEKG